MVLFCLITPLTVDNSWLTDSWPWWILLVRTLTHHHAPTQQQQQQQLDVLLYRLPAKIFTKQWTACCVGLQLTCLDRVQAVIHRQSSHDKHFLIFEWWWSLRSMALISVVLVFNASINHYRCNKFWLEAFTATLSRSLHYDWEINKWEFFNATDKPPLSAFNAWPRSTSQLSLWATWSVCIKTHLNFAMQWRRGNRDIALSSIHCHDDKHSWRLMISFDLKLQ